MVIGDWRRSKRMDYGEWKRVRERERATKKRVFFFFNRGIFQKTCPTPFNKCINGQTSPRPIILIGRGYEDPNKVSIPPRWVFLPSLVDEFNVITNYTLFSLLKTIAQTITWAKTKRINYTKNYNLPLPFTIYFRNLNNLAMRIQKNCKFLYAIKTIIP